MLCYYLSTRFEFYSLHLYLLFKIGDIFSLQTKVLGLRSVISKASNSKADVLIEPGDKIYFGDLFLEVLLLYLVTHVVPYIIIEYQQLSH